MTPLAVSVYWDLPVLLVVFSLVYSATRHDRWDRIVREAIGWGGRMAWFLLSIGGVLYLLQRFPAYWVYTLAAAGAVVAAVMLAPGLFARRKPKEPGAAGR